MKDFSVGGKGMDGVRMVSFVGGVWKLGLVCLLTFVFGIVRKEYLKSKVGAVNRCEIEHRNMLTLRCCYIYMAI